MKTFNIIFDYTPLATVQIDEEKAAALIKEMVDFWSGSEDRLEANDGSYLHTWLKQLAVFILRLRRTPDGDEGWCKLDGTYGIKLLNWEEYEHDEDQIEITETTTPAS